MNGGFGNRYPPEKVISALKPLLTEGSTFWIEVRPTNSSCSLKSNNNTTRALSNTVINGGGLWTAASLVTTPAFRTTGIIATVPEPSVNAFLTRTVVVGGLML